MAQALYQQIADRLIKEVADGMYAVGGTLPGEPDLCSRFGVARNTVRQAIGVLQQLGLVAPRRGIGTVVRARSASPRYVHTVESLASLFEYLQETELHVLGVREFVADDDESAFLRSKPGVRWIKVDAIRIGRDGCAISFTHLYVPEIYREVTDQMEGLRLPSYMLVEKHHGKVVSEVDQLATVTIMPAIAAKQLGVRRGSPAQVVDRHYISETREVLMAAKSYYPPGRFSLSVTLRLNGL